MHRVPPRLVSGVALALALFGRISAQVVISEIMYSPPETVSEAAEFLELVNIGNQPADLSGWTFTSGIKLTFPAGASIDPGQYLVIARDAAVFTQVYQSVPGFVYSGKLDDGGERIRLSDPAGAVVDEVDYSDEPPWPVKPDGLGPSLEVIDPRADNNTPRNWRAAVNFAGHTAGRLNSVNAPGLPPWIGSVDFNARPAPGEPVPVSATVLDAAWVVLVYQVDFGSERSVSMTRGSEGASGTAYQATIPGQPANSLVRLRIMAQGAFGMIGYPRFDDTIQNTGYFVEDPAFVTQVPTIHWFIEPGRYERALEHSHTDETEPAVLVYDGKVFDSIQCRVRGGSARWWPKLHWKFVMAKGHDFDMGGRLILPVDRFNLQGSYGDKSYLREVLSYEAFQEAGVSSNQSFHVRLHQNGRFFGLYVFLEQPDDDWLERHALSEEAAHYKAYGDASPTATPAELQPLYEKESREWEDYTDLWQFLRAVSSSDAESRRRYLFDNFDIPAMVNYLAVNAIIHNNDHIAKNYFLYRDTGDTDRWRMYPWDLDLTFGRNYAGWPHDEWGLVLNDWMWADVDVIPGREDVSPSHPLFGDKRHQKWDFLWNRIIQALFDEADFRDMYWRRLRSLMDQLLAPGRFENRIDALVPQIQAEAALDALRWGQYGEPQSLENAVLHIKNDYLVPRRNHLFVTHRVPGEIPEVQAPDVRVVINEIMYAPAGGTEDEFLELFNCSWSQAVDLSGWRVDEIGLTAPAGTVIPPRGLVVFVKEDSRFRQTYGSGLFVAGGYSGNLSDTGGTLTLTSQAATVIDTVSYSSQSPWPPAAGTGPSLERVDPDMPDTQATNWAASAGIGGTPGARNTVSSAFLSRVFVPLFMGSPWPMAGLAISNAGNAETRFEVTAYNADGTLAQASENPTKRSLPANGQLAQLAEELFPGATTSAWLEIRGDTTQLGNHHLLGNPRELDGGTAATVSATTLYIAPIFSGDGVFRGRDATSHIVLVNPGAIPVRARLRLTIPGIQTFVPVEAERVLPGRGMLSSGITELFGSVRPVSDGYIVVNVLDGEGLVASQWVELGSNQSLFCLPAHNPSAASRLFSAQFASTPELFSEIVLLNQASSARRLTLKLWLDSGELLAEAGPFPIEAGGMTRLDGRTVFGLSTEGSFVGSLDVQADGPGISGSVIFGESARLDYATALPLQCEPFFREAVFSQVANGAGYFTGLALYNPGNEPITVRLRVFDAQANLSGETELILQGKTRTSQLVSELMPSTEGQVRGYVQLLTSGPVVAQEIFGSTDEPRMAAVLPVPLAPP